MGNLVSTSVFKEKSEGLGLEHYRELVESSGYCKLGLGLLISSAETMGNVLCRRKTRDARMVTESSMRLMTRTPAHKELHESANRRDPKLSRLASETEIYEKQWLEFGASRRAKEDLHELFCPLTEEEEHEVLSALHGGSSHELLVTHEASNIEITREVLQCLNRTAWLNDEVINLYLTLLKERERREPKRFLKCHFFNTFFFKKAIYFMDEVEDKSGRKIDITSWKQVKVDNLPLQKNMFDCGMFMLKYTDFYSRGLGLCFGQEHMGYFRKRTIKEILRLRAE